MAADLQSLREPMRRDVLAPACALDIMDAGTWLPGKLRVCMPTGKHRMNSYTIATRQMKVPVLHWKY